MDRFKVTKVQNKDRKTSGINLKNFMRRGSRNPSGGGPDAFRKFSVAALTSEALPRLDNYRISKRALKRPSIGELHGEASTDHLQDLSGDVEAPGLGGHGGIKLGWIEGVVIPCLLNIWGVMLFLRLSWVIGESGILQTLVIIGISALVCVITTLSLSAISTNGEVKGGGVYFIISRSLGPEFGASIGIVFALANAVAASMNTIGFCNSLNDLLASYDLKIVDGGNNDVRIVGVIAIFVMILVCCVGMEWEAKAQNFLLVTIIAAIVNFLVGCAIGPRSDEAVAKGFVGFNLDTFMENMWPDYRFSEKVNQDFFSVFAIFFPSVTGIQAGANISGDLKDPAGAIPKGTLLALFVSMVSYVVFVFFGGAAAARDASGNISDLVNGTLIQSQLECRKNLTCTYGLQNSYSVMQLMSVWGPLIYAGCFAATLSTALTNLLSVPRLIQALGIDRIYPGLIFFSKPYGKHGEPYRGYVLTFIISAGFLLIAELNAIAPLISNFYLASYALINFCTFHAAIVKPLGWRPTFKYYNAWISMFGFVLCVAIMFLIDWLSSLITFVIVLALYLIVVYRKPDVNWGSSTQAQTYKTALTSAYKLQNVSDHVKNYRPQVLVLSGAPESRPPLIDLANLITKHKSLLIVGNSVPDKIGYKARKALLKEGQDYLSARKIKAFYSILDGYNFEDAANCFLKISGIGKLMPNILLMGFKCHWRTCSKKELNTYFNILHNAFSERMAVAILRLPNGLDFSELEHEIKAPNGELPPPASHTQVLTPSESVLQLPKTSEIFHVDSNLNLAGMASSTSTLVSSSPTPAASKEYLKAPDNHDHTVIYLTKGGSNVPKNVLDALTVFSRKQPKGTIDVWWLYDDGGFTMLLPYIISMRSSWSNCKLRVFALTSRRMELEVEKKNVENLLSKLRISYSAIIMLQGVSDKPQQSTIDLHESLLDGFREGDNDECFVLDTELKVLEQKTYLQLRLHEMLKEYSSEACLIVLSLPMPRQENVSAPLYMSWLEMLTMDLPPTILVRGNQASVLTPYS